MVNLKPGCDSITVTAYLAHAHYLGRAIWTELHTPDPHGNLRFVRFQSLICTEMGIHLMPAFACSGACIAQQHGVTANLLQCRSRDEHQVTQPLAVIKMHHMYFSSDRHVQYYVFGFMLMLCQALAG
jgi:hypothetical protein